MARQREILRMLFDGRRCLLIEKRSGITDHQAGR
jgi:hypothetical protein